MCHLWKIVYKQEALAYRIYIGKSELESLIICCRFQGYYLSVADTEVGPVSTIVSPTFGDDLVSEISSVTDLVGFFSSEVGVADLELGANFSSGDFSGWEADCESASFSPRRSPRASVNLSMTLA